MAGAAMTGGRDVATFLRIQTQDSILSRIQDNIGQAFQKATLPIEGAILLKNVTLATGSNTVSHTLGRTLQGWWPVRIRASATLYDKQDSNPIPSKTLVLVASAPVVLDLLVF